MAAKINKKKSLSHHAEQRERLRSSDHYCSCYKKHLKGTPTPHLLLSDRTDERKKPVVKLIKARTSNGGQGGGCPPGREPLLRAPADRHGGAGRQRREGLQGASPGAAVRGRGADLLVLLPRRHRRVHRYLPLPLHQRADGDGREQQGEQVRHRGHPGHRVVLRRHDLRAGLLHRGDLRRPHQPRRHLRPLPGAQALPHARALLHGHAVPRRHLRRRRRQGIPDGALRGQGRGRQLRRARLHQGRRPRRRDRRDLRARLHRLLRHRRQAQRQGLARPHPRSSSDRVRGVPGAPGDHPHHRHRHQPRPLPRRRHHLQQGTGMERPLDLLGGPVHRCCSGRHLPRRRDQGHPLQEPRLVKSSTPVNCHACGDGRSYVDRFLR